MKNDEYLDNGVRGNFVELQGVVINTDAITAIDKIRKSESRYYLTIFGPTDEGLKFGFDKLSTADQARVKLINDCLSLDGGFYDKSLSNMDLVMAPEVVTRWLNLYERGPGVHYYDDEGDALENAIMGADSDYIKTVKVEWEE